MNTIEIDVYRLSLYYLVLIIPFSIILWLRLPMVKETLLAVVRMTLQLTFVGLYLQVVFKLNNPFINALWLCALILVADLSVLRSCKIGILRCLIPIALAILVGLSLPLLVLLKVTLGLSNPMDARFLIPIGGMILGNCMRASIIGIRDFFSRVKKEEKTFLLALGQGATLFEAVRPFIREAFKASIMPTVATMATIGLVSLPGMMTGVILGGQDPAYAIRYQIAIMIAILSGTALTVVLAIIFSLKVNFTPFGIYRSR
ncbi:YbbM seven transmembrane helix protein [Dissulfuribacter thermophilus]|uniref:YbbM seven transmembrane helix protein n=1 Tax=Dissulfuribacter thermophilus TaxID=1156395 RepID=A0A1B9F9A2_9BACT|nr:ABC transporter permease [Dissulfuribacter thermophilus]OCC16497.1 YbbM seven transmembrane helix protein [Dissulfuribacter thermophilus]